MTGFFTLRSCFRASFLAVFFFAFFAVTFLRADGAFAACSNPTADVGEIIFDSGFDHCFKGCTDNGWDVMTQCRTPFVSTWNTANTSMGSSANNQITLPLVASGTYNFIVDWGDGSQSTITGWSQPAKTHTYSTPGTYTVTIKGTITGWQFNNLGDRLKITNISSWGPFKFGNTGSYFYGASNLTITAKDIPDMSGTTNMYYAFRSASSLTTVPKMDQWNMSGVTDMNGMFYDATNFNQQIGAWDTGNVTNMTMMFRRATNFNQPIGTWNTGNVTNMHGLFWEATNFNQPIGTWNTGNVTDMSYMFNQAPSFNQPIGTWNTGNVTTMDSMFNGATAFNRPIGTWNTANVTNMASMFSQATNFNQPIGAWNTANVNNMVSMFYRAAAFNQPIGTWNTANVTSMTWMFREASAFNQPIGTWNTGAVTNMASMFYQASAFNQPIGAWNTSSVTTMLQMFQGATVFNQPIGTWNTGNVTNMQQMFFQATAFNQNVGTWDISQVTTMLAMFQSSAFDNTNYNNLLCSWSTQAVRPNVQFNPGSALYSTVGAGAARSILTSAPNNWVFIGGGGSGFMDVAECPGVFATTWNTSNTSAGSSAANQVTLPLWNGGTYNFTVNWGDGTSSTITAWDQAAKTHTYAAAGTYTIRIRGTISGFRFQNSGDRLKLLNISQWGNFRLVNNSNFYGAANMTITASDIVNTTGLTNANFMFADCTSLTTVPNMGSWNMASVTNMNGMFYGATNFNQNISGWNTGSVTDMSQVFYGASSFNQPIGTWNTSNVTTMNSLFRGASSFNQNISGWDTSNVINMSQIFNGASAFNQNISGWVTNSATTMAYMFQDATAFNQNISGWNTSNVTSMVQMFYGATNFNQPIGAWDVGNVTTMHSMFRNATAFNQDLSGWNVGNVTTMANMFMGSGLQQTNYGLLLCGWTLLPSLQPNVQFHAGSATYRMPDARSQLTAAPNNWVITDGGTGAGKAMNCPDAFVSRWQTDNTSTGSSAKNQVRLPLYNGGTYNFKVYWGDGTSDTITSWDQAAVTHSYALESTYTIVIRGTINGWRFNNTGDRLKLNNISQWGSLRLGNTGGYFYGAANLEVTASDILDTTGTTNMQRAFQGCSSLSLVPNMGSWNMSAVTNTSYMFTGATLFNQNISGWNMANVTNMHSMFRDTAFNQPIGGWNTGSAIIMTGMFLGATSFNQNIGGWNTSNVTDMGAMFQNATSFNQSLANWNISKVTNMTSMFLNSGLTTGNYGELLCAWSQKSVRPNVNFHAGSAQYGTGAPASGRSILTGAPNNWTITDGGPSGMSVMCSI